MYCTMKEEPDSDDDPLPCSDIKIECDVINGSNDDTMEEDESRQCVMSIEESDYFQTSSPHQDCAPEESSHTQKIGNDESSSLKGCKKRKFCAEKDSGGHVCAEESVSISKDISSSFSSEDNCSSSSNTNLESPPPNTVVSMHLSSLKQEPSYVINGSNDDTIEQQDASQQCVMSIEGPDVSSPPEDCAPEESLHDQETGPSSSKGCKIRKFSAEESLPISTDAASSSPSSSNTNLQSPLPNTANSMHLLSLKQEPIEDHEPALSHQTEHTDGHIFIKQEIEDSFDSSQLNASDGDSDAEETQANPAGESDEEWKYCKVKKRPKKRKKRKLKVKEIEPKTKKRGRPSVPKHSTGVKCDYCGKVLANMFSYSEHVRIHTGENPYKCTVCGKAFRTQGTVRVHQMIHDNNRPFECKECGKRFLSGSLLKAHSRVHSTENSFKCVLCPESFRSPLTLKRHILKHTGQQMVKCGKCFKKFFSLDGLAAHKCAEWKPKLKTCKDCGVDFQYNSDLCSYNCRCDTEKVFKCSHCPKYFTSKTGRTHHLKRCEFVEKPFECDVCARKFLDDISLKLHCCNTGNVRSTAPRACMECGLMLSSSSALSRHSVIHKLDKQFQCEECGKVFLRHDELTLHRRIHTGERPFVCKTCGKGFTISSSLIKHNRIHTKERPYICDQCGKTYICKSDLNRHKLFHTGVKPYKCHLCPVAYKTNRSLKDHVVKHQVLEMINA